MKCNPDKMFRTLFPCTCIICRKGACLHSVPICSDCTEVFSELLKEQCLFCGLPAAECICPHNRTVRFLFWYDSPLSHQLIYMLKYRAKHGRVQFLADLLAALCTETYDAVTYVPRRKKDVRIYGYDHARLLAESVAKRLDLPLVCTMESCSFLEQKLLSAAQREKTMPGRYRVFPNVAEAFKHLLLIDDLCTTGATLRACSSLLRKAGAKTVSCVTLAKVPNLYRT